MTSASDWRAVAHSWASGRPTMALLCTNWMVSVGYNIKLNYTFKSDDYAILRTSYDGRTLDQLQLHNYGYSDRVEWNDCAACVQSTLEGMRNCNIHREKKRVHFSPSTT